MKALFSFVFAFAAFMLSQNPAHAKPVVNSDPQTFVLALQEKSYPAELDKSDPKQPVIVTKFSDIPISIVFLGCTDAKNCTHAEIVAPLLCEGVENICSAEIANWQKEENFSGAIYLQDAKTLALYHYIVTGAAGISPEALILNIENVRADLSIIDERIVNIKKLNQGK